MCGGVNTKMFHRTAHHVMSAKEIATIFGKVRSDMTENEAIKEFQQNIDMPFGSNISREASELAIQALETVKKLSDRNMTTEALENYMQFEDECVKKGFTFKSVIEAREKQIAKKPYYEGDGYADGQLVYDTWICPCCDKRYEVDYDNYDYCPNCGQKIDLDRSDEE